MIYLYYLNNFFLEYIHFIDIISNFYLQFYLYVLHIFLNIAKHLQKYLISVSIHG